jgi:hypothetical protein
VIVVAMLEDETMDEADSQFMLVGVSDGQVIRAVVNYLRRARPEVATGGRLGVDEIGADGEWTWEELLEIVEDLPHIQLSWWSTHQEGAGKVYACHEFTGWTERHAADLALAHTPTPDRVAQDQQA